MNALNTTLTRQFEKSRFIHLMFVAITRGYECRMGKGLGIHTLQLARIVGMQFNCSPDHILEKLGAFCEISLLGGDCVSLGIFLIAYS